MCICVRGEGNLAEASVLSSWSLALKPHKVKVPAVPQHGAAHLVDEEGKTYMVQKSPSQFSQRIAPKIWEEQDGIKSTTQSSPEYACDQTVISLYSAGSWDGDRCQDLTSHCVNGVGKWLNFWQMYGQENKLISLEDNTQEQRIEKFQPCNNRFI